MNEPVKNRHQLRVERKQAKLEEHERFIEDSNRRLEKFRNLVKDILAECDGLNCEGFKSIHLAINGSSLKTCRVCARSPRGCWVRFI